MQPHALPPNDLPRRAGVVVIGGGIVGIATGRFLARKGIDAVILDSATDIGTRTTAMSAHCIRAQFSEPGNIQMMAESLAFYEAIAEHCNIPDPLGIALQQQGYLFATTHQSELERIAERVGAQRDAGLPDVELLNGHDIRSRFPWLNGDIVGGSFRSRDGWIDSLLAVQAMAESSGQAIHTGVNVTGIDVDHGSVKGVSTSCGHIACDTVVLAAGPWSRALCPVPLPLRLLRRHRVIVAPRADIPQNGPVVIDADTGAHWRPHGGGALAAWAQPESDMPEVWPVPADPEFADLVLRSNEGIGRLSPFWRTISPALQPADILLTAGQYTITPDHRPLIGPASSIRGLWLHTGYSGHGIMGSPAGARLLADLIDGYSSAPNPFNPDRFARGTSAPDIERVVI